jgi:hypothetical protein
VVEFTVLGIPCIGLNGRQTSACGWCKDKWGISWQITPKVLTDAMSAGGETARRAFEAMMPMQKIDVAAIERAVWGELRVKSTTSNALNSTNLALPRSPLLRGLRPIHLLIGPLYL